MGSIFSKNLVFSNPYFSKAPETETYRSDRKTHKKNVG